MIFAASLRRSVALSAFFIVLSKWNCAAQVFEDSAKAINATDLGAAARVLLEGIADSDTTDKYGPDAIPIGNYTLLGCSSSGPDSKADYLTTYLPTMLSRLSYAVFDAHLGPQSLNGYKSFFKSAPQNVVESVFSDIKQGSPKIFKSRRGDTTKTPKIVCLGEDEDQSHVTGIGNLYEFFCGEDAEDYSPASQFRRTELVVLCPSFFELSPWTSITDCAHLLNGGLWPDGTRMLQSQFAMLVRALAGIYMPASRQTRYTIAADTPANLNSVVALPVSAALASKDSYAYYAAAVEAKCADWPSG